jgi:putative transcriptional regulator
MKAFAAGAILTATPLLDENYFEKTLILITEKNQDGTIGFVLNNPYNRKLNELVEFAMAKPLDIYEGGPVAEDKLFFIHSRGDIIADSNAIAEGIYWGGNFLQALQLLKDGTLQPHEIKLFVGYCGWDAGQLEDEIEEGSWTLETCNIQLVFDLRAVQ